MDACGVQKTMRIGIVGGGLSGLTCGILLQRAGWRVEVFDKGQIGSLKVCGEYLSLEVLPIIENLGIYIDFSRQPIIDKLTCHTRKNF